MTKDAPPPTGATASQPHLAARAGLALAALSGEFAPLLQGELSRLGTARAAWRAGGRHDLDLAAHDLAGLGAMLGAPVAGRIAASLAHLLRQGGASAALVDAHVDALFAVVRQGAAAGDDPRGAELAAVLETAVERRRAAPWPQAA